MNEPQLLTLILNKKNEWFRVGFFLVSCSRCIEIKNTHETIVIIISEFGSQCTMILVSVEKKGRRAPKTI